MGETRKVGSPRKFYCWSCGEEYEPVVVHSSSGTGSEYIPRHDVRGRRPSEPCPAGGYRRPA